MATTPLNAHTVPANSDSPLTGTHMMTFGTSIEKKSVMTFASASARDTAIPLGSRVEGMVAYLNDTNVLTVWDGTAWREFGGARQRVYSAVKGSTGAAATDGTYQWIGVTLTVPNAAVGDWLLSWSLGVKTTIAGPETFNNVGFRAQAITNGVTNNLSNDIGFEILDDHRELIGWTAGLQTTVVSTLDITAYISMATGSGGATWTSYLGSRITAAWLGPR